MIIFVMMCTQAGSLGDPALVVTVWRRQGSGPISRTTMPIQKCYWSTCRGQWPSPARSGARARSGPRPWRSASARSTPSTIHAPKCGSMPLRFADSSSARAIAARVHKGLWIFMIATPRSASRRCWRAAGSTSSDHWHRAAHVSRVGRSRVRPSHGRCGLPDRVPASPRRRRATTTHARRLLVKLGRTHNVNWSAARLAIPLHRCPRLPLHLSPAAGLNTTSLFSICARPLPCQTASSTDPNVRQILILPSSDAVTMNFPSWL